MEATMNAAISSCEKAEKHIRKIAEEDFASIKAMNEAERAAKKVMETYGIFENIEDAARYIEEKSGESTYPLYIKVAEDEDEERYEVKEIILRDADGVPIHNGDAIFLPDDTFFRIQFTSIIPTEDDSLIDKIFYRGVAEKDYEEYLPEKLKEYPIQNFHINDTYVKTLFKVRRWTDAEKLIYLKDREEKVTAINDKVIKDVRTGVILFTVLGFCFGFLLFYFWNFWDNPVAFLFTVLTGANGGIGLSLLPTYSTIVKNKKEAKKCNEESYCYLNNLASKNEISKSVFHKELQRIHDNLPAYYTSECKYETDAIQSTFFER